MRTCTGIEGDSECHSVTPDTTADVSDDGERRAMDETVRWVTKAEAAEES